MKMPSFISSFKVILFFILAVLVCDRLFFWPLYLTYDMTYRASAVAKNNDIFVVGSSHLQKALDLPTMKAETHLATGGVLIPQSNIIVRYYAIKERLTNPDLKPPKLIVLETTKYIFNKNRYGGISVLLMPYYHRGLFQEAVQRDPLTEPQWTLNKIFHSYSFNFQFSQNFFDPAVVGRYLIEEWGPPQMLEKLRAWTKRTQEIPPDSLQVDPRVEKWYTEAAANKSLTNVVDVELLGYFKKIIDLANQYKVKLILLEPPVYRFKDQLPSDGYENVRSIFSSVENERIKHMEVDIGNNSNALEDMSHLNYRYRAYYTRLFDRQMMSFLKTLN